MYDRHITIEKPTRANAKGVVTETWTELCTGWAKRIDEAGDSIEEGSKRTTVRKSTWRMPFVPDLREKDRFYDNSDSTTIYTIVAISEIKRIATIEIKAEQRY